MYEMRNRWISAGRFITISTKMIKHALTFGTMHNKYYYNRTLQMENGESTIWTKSMPC